MIHMLTEDIAFTLGQTFMEDQRKLWVFVGTRETVTKKEEFVFCKVLNKKWPHALETYRSSNPETIIRKFGLDTQ